MFSPESVKMEVVRLQALALEIRRKIESPYERAFLAALGRVADKARKLDEARERVKWSTNARYHVGEACETCDAPEVLAAVKAAEAEKARALKVQERAHLALESARVSEEVAGGNQRVYVQIHEALDSVQVGLGVQLIVPFASRVAEHATTALDRVKGRYQGIGVAEAELVRSEERLAASRLLLSRAVKADANMQLAAGVSPTRANLKAAAKTKEILAQTRQAETTAKLAADEAATALKRALRPVRGHLDLCATANLLVEAAKRADATLAR